MDGTQILRGRSIGAGELSFGSIVGFTAEGAEGRGGIQLDHPLEAVFEVKHVEVDQEPYLVDVSHPLSSAILRGLRGLVFRA